MPLKDTSPRRPVADAKSRKSSLADLFVDCDSPLGVSDYHDPNQGTIKDVVVWGGVVVALALLGAGLLGWLR